ncbi:hypothetical protein NQ176_g9780 [Zarea fungicola]|uniref:Uncharacterized protein n=1 Tax=Zarea fungicola TaxID=93591 RepID=A0ACC1MKI9_9HYPO|nr:hypothetical protein NQ176_g9780 [Lecanicillium fungicola]
MRAQAHQFITQLYNEGLPVFTKTALEDIAQQFDQCAEKASYGQTIRVTALNGAIVEFPLETDNPYPYDYGDDDYRCIMTRPRLVYRTAAELTADRDVQFFSPTRAYLPLEVAHSTEKRCLSTGCTVDGWPTTSYEAVVDRFCRARTAWRASEHYRQFMAALSSATIPTGIRNIVGFACSTMNWAYEDKLPSDAQHALLLGLRDLLSADGHVDVHCIVQDPIYTDIDRQVLQSLNVTVLDDPRAFLEVDNNSVVLSVSPDIPIQQIITDIARPAILLWNRVTEGKKEDPFAADYASTRVISMIRDEYVKVPIPEDRDYFDDLALYVRKAACTRTEGS